MLSKGQVSVLSGSEWASSKIGFFRALACLTACELSRSEDVILYVPAVHRESSMAL